MARRLSIALLLALLAAAPAMANTYLVRPDGTGDFPTIQAAITAAIDGDIIELADGTFTGDGNRDIEYLGKAITVRSQSGDPALCIIDCEGSEADAHRGVYFNGVDDGPDSVLEDVTITNGWAPQGLVQRSGGGIDVVDGAAPTIIGCVLAYNTAPDAGGGMAGNIGSPTVIDCAFIGNEAFALGGGAIAFGTASFPTFENCTFTGNWTSAFGGAYAGGTPPLDDTIVTFENCVFVGNQAALAGGGFATGYGSHTDFEGCLFRENNGGGLGGGGGVGFNSTTTLINCTLADNWAMNGGAIGVAVHAADVSSATLTGCTLHGNVAPAGGSGVIVTAAQSSAVLENTIIAYGEGSALHGYPNLTATCCDVYGNAGGDYAGYFAGLLGVNGNISLDPFFCDAPNGDFSLYDISPCTPDYNPACGLVGAWPVGCTATEAAIDIKPGSCPNSVNLRSKGVLPVAVLGSDGFDVTEIVPGSVRLEGLVAPIRDNLEDVATPIPGDPCECGEMGPDGYMDLGLKFHTWAVREALGEYPVQEDIHLTLTGHLADGTVFVGSDCIVVPHGGQIIQADVAPALVALDAAEPNPFRAETVLSYALPSETRVGLHVYDVSGRQVATLVNGVEAAGAHSVVWDGTRDPGVRVLPGIYFARLEADGVRHVRKVVVLP